MNQKYNMTHIFPMHGGSAGSSYELIVFSATWKAEDIFREEHGVTITPMDGTDNASVITCGTQRIAWFTVDTNGGSLMDSVLSAAKLGCRRMLLLEQTCALAEDLNPGDFLVPNKTIHGGDPLQYLEQPTAGDDCELEVRRTPPKGVLWVNMAAYQKGLRTTTRTVFSCETRACLSGWLKAIRENGADAQDRMSSVFSRCMTRLGVDGASLLVVTERLGSTDVSSEEQEALERTVHHNLGWMLLALAEKTRKAA